MKLLCFLLLILGMLAAGCASASRKPALNDQPQKRPVPPSLHNIDKGLDWLSLLAVVGIGAAVAVAVMLPGTDKISLALGLGSGAVLVASLFIKVSLWLVPWVAGGLAVAGIGYEVYRWKFAGDPVEPAASQ
jgi:CHASE2 domain-containing sensor protein